MSILRRVAEEDRGLDERAGTGETHKVACRFRRHPMHPNERVCDLCGTTVGRSETALHERNHRYEAEWEDKVEMLEAQIQHLQAEFEQIRGEWETVERLVAPGVSHMLGMMEGQEDASG